MRIKVTLVFHIFYKFDQKIIILFHLTLYILTKHTRILHAKAYVEAQKKTINYKMIALLDQHPKYNLLYICNKTS